MAKVVVTPETFAFVSFDANHIVELTGKIADKVGLPADTEIRIEIDETTPLGRTKLLSLDPITLAVEGGSFEDAKRPRQLSDTSVIDVVGRLLFRAKDRLDAGFAAAPDDDALTLQQHTAWDTYAVGRCDRAGWAPQKKRRLYHFRNRHGFTDVADAAFDRLWNADGLTWADLEAACAETEAARVPAG
ncbi:MAG: hypothetical protein H0W70_03330 [Actinobacteria bacterium]|nr:hypothetical protein [Actinomycetota bacterium]